MKLTQYILLFLALSFSVSSFASNDIQITGTKAVRIPLTRLTSSKHKSSIHNQPQQKYKTIRLMKLSFSKEFLKKFNERAKTIEQSQSTNINEHLHVTPADFNIDLGMNNVPVLDQGQYGTCVTFATTAGIDANKKAGDYISQQCNLELGKYLEDYNLTEYSGWEGSFATNVLSQINTYGVINKKNCPDQYPDAQKRLDPRQFSQLGHSEFKHGISTIKVQAANINALIDQLNLKRRVLVATMLRYKDIAGQPINNVQNGLWTLPYDGKFEDFCNENTCGGHEIVVIGYDAKHQLLKIRNSWGHDVGEKGTFYMTYDYYKLMNMDAIALVN